MRGTARTVGRRWPGRSAALLAGVALLTGCAGPTPPPAPGTATGVVPDLRGARVMLFPVQSLVGVGAQADAELAFALEQRRAGVEWVLPQEMQQALTGSPALETRTEGLPVGVFMQAEVRRIGDPLYGYLRRMGALVGSDVALLPVVARYRPESAGVPSGVEIAVALVQVRSADVLWFGMVEGDAGAADDPRVVATAAEALARRLLPLPARGP